MIGTRRGETSSILGRDGLPCRRRKPWIFDLQIVEQGSEVGIHGHFHFEQGSEVGTKFLFDLLNFILFHTYGSPTVTVDFFVFISI